MNTLALIVREIKNKSLIMELAVKSLTDYVDGYHALMTPISKLGANWRLVAYLSCEPILR